MSEFWPTVDTKKSYLPCWKLELVHFVLPFSLVIWRDFFLVIIGWLSEHSFHQTEIRSTDCNSIVLERCFFTPFHSLRLIFLLMLEILRQESQQTDEGTHVDGERCAKLKLIHRRSRKMAKALLYSRVTSLLCINF